MYHAYKFALVIFYLSLFKFFNLVVIFYSLLWKILIQASTENLTAHSLWFTQANFTTLFNCLGKVFRQFFWFFFVVVVVVVAFFVTSWNVGDISCIMLKVLKIKSVHKSLVEFFFVLITVQSWWKCLCHVIRYWHRQFLLSSFNWHSEILFVTLLSWVGSSNVMLSIVFLAKMPSSQKIRYALIMEFNDNNSFRCSNSPVLNGRLLFSEGSSRPPVYSWNLRFWDDPG